MSVEARIMRVNPNPSTVDGTLTILIPIELLEPAGVAPLVVEAVTLNTLPVVEAIFDAGPLVAELVALASPTVSVTVSGSASVVTSPSSSSVAELSSPQPFGSPPIVVSKSGIAPETPTAAVTLIALPFENMNLPPGPRE